jgi:hypothetical protein
VHTSDDCLGRLSPARRAVLLARSEPEVGKGAGNGLAQYWCGVVLTEQRDEDVLNGWPVQGLLGGSMHSRAHARLVHAGRRRMRDGTKRDSMQLEEDSEQVEGLYADLRAFRRDSSPGTGQLTARSADGVEATAQRSRASCFRLSGLKTSRANSGSRLASDTAKARKPTATWCKRAVPVAYCKR